MTKATKPRETGAAGAQAADQPEIGPPTFTEAMRELEAILARIEEEEVDLDRLGVELERAAKLLDVCRAKIRKAELEVTQIVQRLESPADSPSTAEEGAKDG